MYNFLTKKTARFLCVTAIIFFILCGIWVNYALYGGGNSAVAAFMV